jgi:hypothetical protein
MTDETTAARSARAEREDAEEAPPPAAAAPREEQEPDVEPQPSAETQPSVETEQGVEPPTSEETQPSVETEQGVEPPTSEETPPTVVARPSVRPVDSPPIHVEPMSDPAGVFAIPDLAAAGVAGPLIDATDEGDTAFVETLDEETLHFGEPAPAPVVCQWCNEPLADPDAEMCPHCGGRLRPVDEAIDVPGVTTLPTEALEAELRLRRRIQDAASSASARALGETPEPTSAPSRSVLPPVADGSDVFRPPSDEVARLMREMELQARIAQLEREVPDEVLERAEAAAAAQRAAEAEASEAPEDEGEAAPAPDALAADDARTRAEPPPDGEPHRSPSA